VAQDADVDTGRILADVAVAAVAFEHIMAGSALCRVDHGPANRVTGDVLDGRQGMTSKGRRHWVK